MSGPIRSLPSWWIDTPIDGASFICDLKRMTRIAIHGVAGRMGRSLVDVLRQDPAADLVAAMDHPECGVIGVDAGRLDGTEEVGVTVTSDLEAFLRNVEVVIDFSAPSATARLLPLCAGQRVPVVVGTTGLGGPERAALERAAEIVPVVYAPNYSQGITALFHLAGQAARLLGPGFDAEITELHHKHKVDAPSGTAVHLAEVVVQAKGLVPEEAVKHGRCGQVGERNSQELGVMALRGGDAVGEHTLYLIGEGERLELTHRATDRAIFARGAVRAAHWVARQTAGLYDMADVLGIAR